eukprot:3941407-Rhodomonas_salina.3
MYSESRSPARPSPSHRLARPVLWRPLPGCGCRALPLTPPPALPCPPIPDPHVSSYFPPPVRCDVKTAQIRERKWSLQRRAGRSSRARPPLCLPAARRERGSRPREAQRQCRRSDGQRRICTTARCK